jgi:repressor LexA
VVVVAGDRWSDGLEGGVKDLTDRQHQVLTLIAEGLVTGNPPTIREMCRALGVASTNGINDFLVALQRKGALKATSARRPRRYELSDAAWRLLGYEKCGHCGARTKGPAGRREAA